MNTYNVNKKMLNENIYSDFHNFQALQHEPLMRDKLVTLYQSIFGEPDGWNEHYTYDEVLHNLSQELDKNAYLRLALDSTQPDELTGFCWAQLQSLRDICDAVNTVQHYQMLGSPDIYTPLKSVVGDGPFIYLHDLGIRRDLRGHLSLSKLIWPVLHGVAAQTGVNNVLFWTVAETNVSKLAKRAGFDLVMLHTGMQFYAGSI